MVVLKIKIYKCYFKYLNNVPKELRKLSYYKYQININKTFCTCKICDKILLKRYSFLANLYNIHV